VHRFLTVQILLIAAICPLARAAVINVPDDFETIRAGWHTATWNGERLAAGIYFIRLESDSQVRVTKGVIVK